MLEVLVKVGEYEKVIDIIKIFWGVMLDLGVIMFWEDFNLDWIFNVVFIDEFVLVGKKDIYGDFGVYCYFGFCYSFCYGWFLGFIIWLLDYVLGIKIVDVECK